MTGGWNGIARISSPHSRIRAWIQTHYLCMATHLLIYHCCTNRSCLVPNHRTHFLLSGLYFGCRACNVAHNNFTCIADRFLFCFFVAWVSLCWATRLKAHDASVFWNYKFLGYAPDFLRGIQIITVKLHAKQPMTTQPCL